MSTPQGSRRAGFTIVEVVLAMGILLLGMGSILGLLSFGATLSRTASLRNQGAAALDALSADLREALFPLVLDEATGRHVAGPPRALSEREVPGSPGVRYSAQATLVPVLGQRLPGEPELYRVDVEVTWTSGGGRQTRGFSMLLAREVPFGERMRRLFLTNDLDPLGAPPAGAPPVAPGAVSR